MAVGTQLDKELLIKLVQSKTMWSESLLRSLSADSLSMIYKYILKKHTIAKSSIKYNRSTLPFIVPSHIRNELGLSKGDRFGIVTRRFENEVILDPELPFEVKMRYDNIVQLPGILYDKKFFREKDDVFVRVEGNRIILKSFTYLQ